MDLKETYAIKLRSLRLGAGLSQYDLAKKLNISQANIGRYEKAVTFPSVEVMIKIADYFDTTLDFFFGRDLRRKRQAKQRQFRGNLQEAIKEEIQPGTDLYDFLQERINEILENQKKK